MISLIQQAREVVEQARKAKALAVEHASIARLREEYASDAAETAISASEMLPELKTDFIIYRGQMRNDLRQGLGVLRYAGSEQRFEGVFQLDQFSLGVFYIDTGISYSGEFAEKVKSGHGVMKNNSVTYSGQFAHGEMSGYGIQQENGSYE